MGKKRTRDPKGLSMTQTKKKKRIAKMAAHRSADQDKNSTVVAVDDLNWKGVALPDLLEDTGGFLGLEEIEGVDVVQPEGKGEIQFKVSVFLFFSFFLSGYVFLDFS